MNIFGNKYHLLQIVGCYFAGKSILIILFIISCTTMKSSNTEQKKESHGGKLSVLDDKLERFAKKHNTSVRSPASTHYNSKNHAPIYDSLENREISWIDGSIAKAIMVTPYSTNLGFSPNTWDVCILAWLYDAPTFEKPHWIHYLLKNADINILEQNIDPLLIKSEQKLANIKPGDLK